MSLTSHYNSHASIWDQLAVMRADDNDLFLETSNHQSFPNAAVRLRTSIGGGRNLLLRDILHNMAEYSSLTPEVDFITPVNFKSFRFFCDDNPGSHLGIHIANDAVGFQTVCHDQEKNFAAGGHLCMQGEGPVVWLSQRRIPNIHRDLKSALIDQKATPHELYGPRSFCFMTPEAA